MKMCENKTLYSSLDYCHKRVYQQHVAFVDYVNGCFGG